MVATMAEDEKSEKGGMSTGVQWKHRERAKMQSPKSFSALQISNVTKLTVAAYGSEGFDTSLNSPNSFSVLMAILFPVSYITTNV